jgi:hypothetical protein
MASIICFPVSTELSDNRDQKLQDIIASLPQKRMLTMPGIIIGLAAVIVMVAVGYGAHSRIREQINTLGTNMIVISPRGNCRSMINGVDADHQAICTWQTDSGTFFGLEDVLGARSVATLGSTAAQRLFANSNPVG